MAVVFANKKVLALRPRHPGEVIQAFPKHQVVDGEQFGVTGQIVGVPHVSSSLTIMRNIGLETRGVEPIRYYYQYPKLGGQFDPMDHQYTTAEFFTTHPRLFCLNEQRTGKTSAAIWAADFLLKEKTIKAVLVVCTMSCLRTVWENEIFMLTPDMSVGILHGSAEKRKATLARDYKYFVVNHDGIKTIRKELVEAVRSGRIDLVIIDELAEFSDAGTDKYKAMMEIAEAAPRIWGLTATPMSKGPSAVWGQARLINKANVPEFLSHWRYTTEIKVSKYKWVPKKEATEIVYAALQPAIRFAKRDVLKHLPPLTFSRREAPLTPEQTGMIKELRKQGAMLLQGKRLTIANSAVLIGKMAQICAGAVKLDDGTTHRIDCRPRLAELLDIIQGTSEKFVVLANHHAEVDLLQEILSPRYNTEWIDGRKTGAAREAAIRRFITDKKCRGLVAHPQTISHGLEFSVADTMVWWSPTHKSELVAQANQRMASAAQRNPMGVYYIGSGATEWRIYRNTEDRLANQVSMLDLFKNFLEEG